MPDRTETTQLRRARLLLPSLQLGACVFCGVLRDTRGVALSDAERFNYLPATPMATLHWVFEGELVLVRGGARTSPHRLDGVLPRLLVSGPQSQPTVSWSTGPVYALSVAFFPEALGVLLGCSAASLAEDSWALSEIAPPGFLQACESLFEPGVSATPFERLEARLRPLWSGAQALRRAPLLSDWIYALGSRLALSGAGRSLRQRQRHVKAGTGQSLRDLHLYARVESAVLSHLAAAASDRHGLADLAAAAGYADQSHMNREFRRVTGWSAARLLDRAQEDEAFWLYRLLGESIESGLANPVSTRIEHP